MGDVVGGFDLRVCLSGSVGSEKVQCRTSDVAQEDFVGKLDLVEEELAPAFARRPASC